MHDDRPHAHRFHEDDVHEQMTERLGIFHHAAAKFDDGDFVAKLADPAHRLDQNIGLFHRVFQDGAPLL